MIATIFAAMLAVQASPPATPTLPHDPRPEPREESIDERLDRTADSRPPSTPEALQGIHDFGACVADNSPDMAGRVLRMDFRTSSYRNALQNLSRNNRDCFQRGRMRSNNLLFAGALAERMLARDATALNARLARAATRPVSASFGPSDGFATCVVRAMPDEAAALFATPVASTQETQAIAALNIGLQRCATGMTDRMTTSPAGLRAILATAAFRAVAPVPAEVAE